MANIVSTFSLSISLSFVNANALKICQIKNFSNWKKEGITRTEEQEIKLGMARLSFEE